jgi:hypothetical protein
MTALKLNVYYAALLGAIVLAVWGLSPSATHTVIVPEYTTEWDMNDGYPIRNYVEDGYHEETEGGGYAGRAPWQVALGLLGAAVVIVATPVEIGRWRAENAATAAKWRALGDAGDFVDYVVGAYNAAGMGPYAVRRLPAAAIEAAEQAEPTMFAEPQEADTEPSPAEMRAFLAAQAAADEVRAYLARHQAEPKALQDAREAAIEVFLAGVEARVAAADDRDAAGQRELAELRRLQGGWMQVTDPAGLTPVSVPRDGVWVEHHGDNLNPKQGVEGLR